jgi:hypothetical protein
VTPALDIFRLEHKGALWLETAATLEAAKVRVRELGAFSPGEYLIVDRKTGSRYVIELDDADGRSTTSERKSLREEDTP